MGIPGSANPMLFGGAAAYQINQSLRFNSADSAYLNRTQSSGSGRKVFTISFWAKLGALGTSRPFLEAYLDGSNFFFLGFTTANRLQIYDIIGGTDYGYIYEPVYRDPSAWYHIMNVWNTDNATASQRIRTYVNGVELTTKDTDHGDPTSGYVSNLFNTSYTHSIGRRLVNTTYFDGYMAEYYVIDGTALTPSSFGETDTITGAWIPKKYSGSYGTNGFYLKFQSSGIGTDSSGNGNTWTANNFSTSGTGTDVMSDTPTNNYATLNALTASSILGSYTLSNGNLDINLANSNRNAFGTIELPATGQWYWEYQITTIAGGGQPMGGISLANITDTSNAVLYRSVGEKLVDGTQTSYGASYTTTDIIGVAADSGAATVTFYKNGVSQGSISHTVAGLVPSIRSNVGGDVFVMNFGQRAFAYTPPTGFKALNTANLPEPTIKKPSSYFDTLLYSGNSSTQTISGLGFSPDLVWMKVRNDAQNHRTYDSVRGATIRLMPSSTQGDFTATTELTSFNSNGFSLGSNTDVNGSGFNYVAWCWDANGAGSSNTAGTITSTVSANASAGFSIVSYTGNGTSGSTVGHGLGVAPKMIIVKNRSSSSDWMVWRDGFASNEGLNLNNSDAKFTSGSNTFIYDVTSTNFKIGTSSIVNAGSNNFIAYCFSEVAGYSKFGSYTGNGSSDGPFVFCGFRPRWIMIKVTNVATTSWMIRDTARNPYNIATGYLFPNSSSAEFTNLDFDIYSNGFKPRHTNNVENSSGSNYIFAAFAELPAKYSNAR